MVSVVSCVIMSPWHFGHLTTLQLGSWRTTTLPSDVGAILSGGECDRVRDSLFPTAYKLASADNGYRYIVDAADRTALPIAAEELHELVDKPTLEGIPLLVLGNKSDLPNKLTVDELIEAMDLKSITRREVSCYGISAKEETNLDAVLHWLIARASR